ncbi:MAG: HAD-IA family hydrolase, partial [Bacteroidota bacterium]
EKIATSDWNEAQDAGRSLAAGTEWLVQRHPEHAALIRAFYDRWVEMLGGPIAGTVTILKELFAKDTHPIYALTNWSAETFPIAQERYDFLSWFKGTLVSGAEGMRKPDPRFFRLLTSRYGIDLETAIFIDDSLRNVKGSEAVGMRALHFTSPEQLRKDLQTLKLL